MKINKFYAAALAATVLLASCAKEEGTDKGKTADGKETYAGVNITIPASTMTRADDAAAGITGEKTITTVGVYIVDAGNARLDYKLLTVATDFSAPTTNGSSQQVYSATTAVPTVTGTKKVYVVANPSQAIQDKLAVSGSTAMNGVAFGISESNFLSVTGSTLNNMVLSGVYTATGGELDMTTVMTPTEAVQTANLVSITIGRNLSKAVVQEGPDYSVTGGTTTLSWAIINKANDAYFLPQTAGTLYRTVPSEALVPVTGDAHAYWTNFSASVAPAGDYVSVLSYGGSDAKTASYVQSKYMFENIPADFHQGNTTAARIKGIFVPTTIYNAIVSGAPVAGSISSGQDFYRSTIDGSYWTSNGRAEAVSNSYNNHTATDFLYYQGGVGYYTIWVNDGAGNKGVKRNGYYLMQINEVRGPGNPEGTLPPLPPVEDDTNLGVEITVLNWDFMKSVQDIQ